MGGGKSKNKRQYVSQNKESHFPYCFSQEEPEMDTIFK